ncbi:MAG: thioredoxin [Patescibacteria group bacterium]|jgi:thioredoxin 1
MSEIILDDKNFEAEVLASDVPVLVDFYAVWCGPCKIQGPMIDELAEEMKDQKVKIAKLDVDKAPEFSQKYEIMSVPTLIIFKGGQIVERMTGMRTKEELKEKLEKLI